MTAINSKSDVNYLNKLADQYNYNYHCSICKKLAHSDDAALTEKIEMNLRAPKFKIDDRVRTTKYKKWSKKKNICDQFCVEN